MAVNLVDLVGDLRIEVNAPGQDGFPGATDADWLNNLRNAFWEARLDGLLTDYTESGGIVTPISGTTDMSRELQQVIIFYAGYRIVKNVLRNIQTRFRAKAGPVEYETAQSATQLTEILRELRHRRDLLLERLAQTGQLPSYYVDAYLARTQSMELGDTAWVGSGTRSIQQGW